MAQDIINLFTSEGFNIKNLSKQVKSIKKKVDKTLDVLTVHEKKLSNGTVLFYHSMIEVIKFCTEHMQTKEFCFVSIVTFIDGYMRERFGKKCSDAIYMTLG